MTTSITNRTKTYTSQSTVHTAVLREDSKTPLGRAE